MGADSNAPMLGRAYTPAENAKMEYRSGDSSTKLKRQAKKPGIFGSLFGIIIRLLLWYGLFTIIWRCPSNLADVTHETSQICKPYLQARSSLRPYLQPYYDTHVSPHIEKARPYYDHAQTRYIQPASDFTQDKYQKFGQPLVQQAYSQGVSQWETSLKPQWRSSRKQLGGLVDTHLGPHLRKIDQRVKPYYNGIRASVNDIWNLELKPAYKFIMPYLQRLYYQVDHIAIKYVIPYSQYANRLVWTALNRHVFPTLQVLYGENVEPQITRITQRLGRYRDEKKLESAVRAVDSSSSLISTSTSTANIAASLASSIAEVVQSLTASSAPTAIPVSSVLSSKSSSIEIAKVSPSVSEVVTKSAAELFARDLDLWNRQVQKAVEEGSNHLNQRVETICNEQISNQIERLGSAHLTQLEELQASNVESLQKTIQKAVSNLPEDAPEESITTALKDIEDHIRLSGQKVKTKAEAIRQWRKASDAEAVNLIQNAVDSTLETIENIRDLRLQEIGRHWASHEDISHQDWIKYNELKKTTAGTWRNSIEELAGNHKSLPEMRSKAVEVEEKAMAVAEAAAKELGRLKRVAAWKLQAGDDTDDFENKIVPARLYKVKEKMANAISDASAAVAGSPSQGTLESLGSVLSSRASEAVDSVSSAAAILSSSASSISESLAKKPIVSSAMEKVSDLGSSASDLSTEAVSAIPMSVKSGVASVSSFIRSGAEALHSKVSLPASQISGEVSSSGSKLSSKVNSAASQISDTVSSTASELSSTVSSAAQSFSQEQLNNFAVDASAKASEVSESGSSKASSLTSIVGDEVNSARDVTSKAKTGLSKVSESVAEISSAVIPTDVTDKAHSVVQHALSSESSSLLPASEGMAESVSEAVKDTLPEGRESPVEKIKVTRSIFAGAMAQEVGDRQVILDEPIEDDSYQPIEAVLNAGSMGIQSVTDAVREAIYGKTTTVNAGFVAKVTSVPSALYESAMSAASKAYYGEPSPTGIEAAKIYALKQYDAAVEAASRIIYNSATSAVSSVQSIVTSQSVRPDVAVSSKYSAAMNLASEQSSIAKSRLSEQMSSASLPIHKEMLSSINSAYSAATSRASKQLLVVTPVATSVLSTQLAFDSFSSIAASKLSQGLSLASEQYSKAKSAAGLTASSTPTGVLDQARRQYYEGVGYAHDQYSSYLSSASRAMRYAGFVAVPTSTPIYEGMLSSAQSQYAVAVAAANSIYTNAVSAASSAAGLQESTPAQGVIDAAAAQYSSAISAASNLLNPAQTPAYQAMLSAASSRYNDISAAASDQYDYLTEMAKSAAGATSSDDSILQSALTAASSQYAMATAAAASAFAQVSTQASFAVYGTSTDKVASASSAYSAYIYGTDPAWTDDIASKASQNWELMISRASSQIYGRPTPYYEAVASQASSYAGIATLAAADQYTAVAQLVSSLISGHEPAFTDRVMSQLSSVYYTSAFNVAYGASSVVHSAYSGASSGASSVVNIAYSSASSVIVSVFTPPAAIDDILSSVSASLDGAVSAAASQVLYSTSVKGNVEQATSAAVNAASHASSYASQAIYGTSAQAQYLSQFSDAAASANSAIYAAVFGSSTPTATPTGYLDNAAQAVNEGYASASSVVDGMASGVSSMLWGPEKTLAVESATGRIAQAVESARAKLEELSARAGDMVGNAKNSLSGDNNNDAENVVHVEKVVKVEKKVVVGKDEL